MLVRHKFSAGIEDTGYGVSLKKAYMRIHLPWACKKRTRSRLPETRTER